MPFLYVQLACVILLSTITAITDAHSGRIPNWVTLPGVLLGLTTSRSLLAPKG